MLFVGNDCEALQCSLFISKRQYPPNLIQNSCFYFIPLLQILRSNHLNRQNI